MTTIPASQLVQIVPGVLDAGGNALVFNGILLTTSWRVPIGTVSSFPNTGTAVSQAFGPAALETALAAIYFNGYDNSLLKPNSIYFAQYNEAAVPAYLLGESIASYTIPQLAALSGSITIIVDGYTRTDASLSLSGATSYSAAAALIQTGLNTLLPTEASVTGSITAQTISVTGSISGNVLYVTAVTTGMIVPGTIITGSTITANTIVTSQLSGTTGGIGTYAINNSQIVPSETISGSYGLLTVTAVSSGTISVDQTLAGSSVTAGTQVYGLGTGLGLAGTYYVSPSQTAASTTITATPTPVSVLFDSISGGILIKSGVVGSASTIAYATGTLATALNLTQSTGAVTSQGAYAATPASFMTNLTQVTQNWASFMTIFDPDGGTASVSSGSNIQKQAFAAWTNNSNNRYAYICWDADITATEQVPATTCLGSILQSSNSSGTAPIYDPANGPQIAAFICGSIASIDFEQTNGRITFAYRSQAGLTAGVTSATVADNLAGAPQIAGNYGNGYNFYGAYATANENFVLFQRGTVSGEFIWLDSYINQIWLNNALQLSLLELLINVGNLPYNTAGYALVESACLDPINAALNFGAIRAGVPLSQSQIAEVNNQAGFKISDILQQQGWYLLILPASPQVRQGRASPPITLWYVDGQSIQAISLASVEVM